MYPNLLLPLLVAVALLIGWLGYVAVFQPVSRRLAGRQVLRRPSEAVLAISGATLGTAIIVGALTVGDTLNFSVRQQAYRTLGPVDERVLSQDPASGALAASKLSALRHNPDVDGVLPALVDQSAALRNGAAGDQAEPRVLAWDLDYRQAAAFGHGGGPSGLSGSPPTPGHVMVNAPLARSIHLRAGDRLTLYLYGRPHRYTVARVVPEYGLAGVGFGASVNRNVFLPHGDLAAAAYLAGTRAQTVTFVSNRGGVERGADRTDAVAAAMQSLLTGLPVTVDTPKRAVLDAARKTGDALGALFLMIGSFSIIAGALLLVNIFTMLAEERKSQLGMLRAVGMKRARLVGSFGLEGASYALAAAGPGVVVGLGVGWAVARLSAQIFQTWSTDGTGLVIHFSATPTSVVNGVALGLVITLLTILVTSLRISHFNVIAAVRDLPATPTPRSARWVLIGASCGAVVTGLASVPAVARSAAVPTLVLPSLTAALLIPALRRRLDARWTTTVVGLGVLGWAMVAPVVRPHMFDTPSMAVFVVQGCLVAFSAVAVISQNQAALLSPLRPVLERSSETGLALRLAVAYPLAKRFRTGATLIMYTLVMLVLVLLVEITGVINASIDSNVSAASAGYSLRIDVNPVSAPATLAAVRQQSRQLGISGIAPLTTATTLASDPGHRTRLPIRAVAVGLPADSVSSLKLESRLPGLHSDRQVWALVERDPRYVAIDSFFNASGGPNGRFYSAGDSFTMTNPETGLTLTRTIAGILSSAVVFYPTTGDGTNTYPILSGDAAVRQQFGSAAQVSAALLRTRSGVDPRVVASRLQTRFLAASLAATPIDSTVRKMFAANTAFFRLMQGFLALGLLVGITGLGVVMVRAVRERRRTIGVMRALGFQSRTVRRSFLAESGFVALEGVVLGSVLGVLTTWLMYQKSAAFNGVRTGFPIEWLVILLLAGATLLASVAATIAPARRASRVLPAIAVRVAD